MKLTQLGYVAAIAEHGSLRAAARHLGVAQPAFSRSLAELERELGAPLFEKAEVRLKDKPLVILAEGWSPTNRYVQKTWLNDTPLDRTWIRHGEIEKGGVLRFAMAAEPVKR